MEQNQTKRNMMKKEKIITLRLSHSLHEKLTKDANDKEISVSALIRIFLTRQIKGEK